MRGKIRAMTLPNILTVTKKNGKVFRYVRVKGRPLVALPDLPMTSPEFLEAYSAAMKGAPKRSKAPAGSIAAMIEAYLASERHAALSVDYRRIIRREAEEIRKQAEDALARHLKREHIIQDLDPLPVNKANARLKAWRLICEFGKGKFMPADPSDSIKRKRPKKTDGHPPWTRAEIEAYRARWPIGTTARAAMELLYWTGARISDAVMTGPGMVGRDGVLAFTQKKTGDKAYVPWTCPLPPHACENDRALMHEAIACLSGHMTFLAAHGKTRSHKGLGTMIANCAREAGFRKSAHGLRKSRSIDLIDRGATPHQTGAWTGHHSLKEIEDYTREFERRAAVIGTEQDRNDENRADPVENTARKRLK